MNVWKGLPHYPPEVTPRLKQFLEMMRQSFNLTSLLDVDGDDTPAANDVVTWNATKGKFDFQPGGGSAGTVTLLSAGDGLVFNTSGITNQAQLEVVNGRWVAGFRGATANDQGHIEGMMPAEYDGGTLTMKFFCFMESATTGDVDLDVEVEAISSGDFLDLDASSSFDTANSSDNNSVPATAGYPFVISVTLTNKDSVAAGDHVRFRVTRDQASDTASGKLYIYGVALEES